VDFVARHRCHDEKEETLPETTPLFTARPGLHNLKLHELLRSIHMRPVHAGVTLVVGFHLCIRERYELKSNGKM
jgi:hypothetical protein